MKLILVLSFMMCGCIATWDVTKTHPHYSSGPAYVHIPAPASAVPVPHPKM